MSMSDETRDELISAVLDGEATEAEAAQVRDDPALAARLDELAAVKSRLQVETSVPPPGAADAAVAAALEASTAPAAAPVVTHPRWRRAAPVLAAAAAVFVVIIGAVALTRPASHSTTSTATAARPPADEAQSAASTTTVAPDTEKAAGAQSFAPALPAAAAPSPSLGSFSDQQSLVDAAKRSALLQADSEPNAVTNDRSSAEGPPTTTVPAPVGTCTAPPRSDPLVLDGSATYDGRPMQVFVYDVPPGLTVVVLDATQCTTLFTDGP
jgi:negative regulator of sigma E activity